MEQHAAGPSGSDTRKRAVSSGNATDAQTKRSRVSRACDQCRSSREKCVGGTGGLACQTCEAQDRRCTYDEPPKKRGIQPNYIRTLELALAWVSQYAPEAQSALSQALPVLDSTAHRLISGKDASGAESLHQSWRDGLLCKQIDQLLSGSIIESSSAASVEPTIRRSRHHVGTTADRFLSAGTKVVTTAPEHLDPHLSRDNVASNARDYGIAAASDKRTPFTSTVDHHGSVDQATFLGDKQSPMPLKLPLNSWNLLDYYFAFTQSWLPITEKHSVLRTTYSYPGEGLSLDKAEGGAHAELWSVLALAAYQVSCIAPLDEDYKELCQTARRLIPRVTAGTTDDSEQSTFELGHVRALLILAMLDATQESWSSAWLTVGLATRLLMLEDLRKEYDGQMDIRVLLFAAFVIDHTVSTQLGLRPHVRSSDLHTTDTLAEDGMEEWAPWTDPIAPNSGSKAPSKAWSTFNAITSELRTVPHDSSPSNVNSLPPPHTVRALLTNACRKEGREQPAKLVTALQANRKSLSSFSAPVPMNDTTKGPQGSSSNGHSRHQENDTATPLDKNSQPSGFMTIPSGPGDFQYLESLPLNDIASQADASLWPMYDLNGITSGNDIFEELAMLDPVEPLSQQPQFMQNLGFNNPDLDLAEFFGADYQATNPLLTYMQPPPPIKPSGEFG